MPVISTPNRLYPFPETDINLEASNGYLRTSIFNIDADIQVLFNDKADLGVSYTREESDQKLIDYDNQLDIYGEYTTGDVLGTTELYLKTDTFATPGFYSKVNVNNKGLVVGYSVLIKNDVTDFNESDYVHSAGTETIGGLKTFTGETTFTSKVNLNGGADINTEDLFDDDSNTSYDRGWSANKIYNKVNEYVPLTSYNDSDVLSKLLNVDGAGSGLDAELLYGNQYDYYLDWTNFLNTPTSLIEYNITADDIKQTYESNSDTNAYTDYDKSKVDNLPNDTNTQLENINTILTSDDSTLDELQEIVDYIKTNKEDLQNLSLDNIAETDDYKLYTADEKTKLYNIEENATADQTAEEIKSLYESLDDTNAYTDADKTKVSESAITTAKNDYTVSQYFKVDNKKSTDIDTITFDISGMSDGSADITIDSITEGTSADLVGKIITIDGIGMFEALSEDAGVVTLDEALSNPDETGTGYLRIMEIDFNIANNFHIDLDEAVNVRAINFQNGQNGTILLLEDSNGWKAKIIDENILFPSTPVYDYAAGKSNVIQYTILNNKAYSNILTY